MLLCDTCRSSFIKNWIQVWFYSLLANWKHSNHPQKRMHNNQTHWNTNPFVETTRGHRDWDVRTHSDLHRQLALAGVFGVDGELHREAGREAGGEPGAAGTHLTGIMSGLNAQLERTEREVWGIVLSWRRVALTSGGNRASESDTVTCVELPRLRI